MAEKDTIVCVHISDNDVNKTHFYTIIGFGAQYMRLGYKVRFTDVSNEGGQKDFLNLLSQGCVAMVHCEQGQSLSLSIKTDSEGKNIYDHYQVPVFSQIRDPVITPWLFVNLIGGPENLLCFHVLPWGASLARLLGLSKGHHEYAHHTYYDVAVGPEGGGGDAGRLFYAGKYLDPNRFRRLIIRESPHRSKIFDRMANIDYGFSDLSILESIKNDKEFASICEEDRGEAAYLAFSVFMYKRFKFREDFFRVLSEFPVDIFSDGWIPNTGKPLKARFMDRLTLREVLARISRSSHVLCCHSGANWSYGDRGVNALRFGATPILNMRADGTGPDWRTHALGYDSWDRLRDHIDAVLTGSAKRIEPPDARVLYEMSPEAQAQRCLLYTSPSPRD